MSSSLPAAPSRSTNSSGVRIGSIGAEAYGLRADVRQSAGYGAMIENDVYSNARVEALYVSISQPAPAEVLHSGGGPVTISATWKLPAPWVKSADTTGYSLARSMPSEGDGVTQ